MTHPSTITTLAAMSFVSLMLIVGILVCDECRIERLTTFFFFFFMILLGEVVLVYLNLLAGGRRRRSRHPRCNSGEIWMMKNG